MLTDLLFWPHPGGAMKSTKSGQKWAHVACALWIPEVSIGSVERMEPITKIPNIPVSLVNHPISLSPVCCVYFTCSSVTLHPSPPPAPPTAKSVGAGVCAVPGASGRLHPVLRQDLQDGLPRHLRLQALPGNEGHYWGWECRWWCQTEGKWCFFLLFFLSSW